MMPVGVEHNLLHDISKCVHLVPLPLMPVGVEHAEVVRKLETKKNVPLPLMPVGVEHDLLRKFAYDDTYGAFTFDACRR